MSHADSRDWNHAGVQGSPLAKSEGSVLSVWPNSQSGVRSAAPGSGLEPPRGGQGGPVVPRLQGDSMEVDHPVGRSRGRCGHTWLMPHITCCHPQVTKGQGLQLSPLQSDGNSNSPQVATRDLGTLQP